MSSSSVQERFAGFSPGSLALQQRAARVTVDGVHATSKFLTPYPVYTVSGKGSRIRDVDGREYVDCAMGQGPLLLGHAHPHVLERIREQAGTYLLCSTVNPWEVELAERLAACIPCAEAIRLTTSGSEANMLAVRLARAFTGREVILRPNGDNLGWADPVIPGLVGPYHQPGAGKPYGESGLLPEVRKSSLAFEFNDFEGMKKLAQRVGENRIAAVVMEPALRALIAPQDGYLDQVREFIREIGALLIFDEIGTGFRTCLGGAQEYFGVTPDLATFGKVIGGGFPLGMAAGRRDVMERLSIRLAEKRVHHGSTWPGSPLTCTAALATLDVLTEPETYSHLLQIGQLFHDRLSAVIRQKAVPLQVIHIGPVAMILFTDEPVWNFNGARPKTSPEVINEFRMALLVHGVITSSDYLPGLRCYLSLAHSVEDMEVIERAFAVSIEEVFFSGRK